MYSDQVRRMEGFYPNYLQHIYRKKKLILKKYNMVYFIIKIISIYSILQINFFRAIKMLYSVLFSKITFK